MDFAIPDELTALRASFAAFLDREVRPLDERVAASFHAGVLDGDVRDAALAVKRRSCAEGFYAAQVREEAGGWGVSTRRCAG